jgi:hypothetical protein
MIILPNRLIANGQNCLSMVEKSLDGDLCQATVFCDWQGILMIDSLDKGSTVIPLSQLTFTKMYSSDEKTDMIMI